MENSPNEVSSQSIKEYLKETKESNCNVGLPCYNKYISKKTPTTLDNPSPTFDPWGRKRSSSPYYRNLYALSNDENTNNKENQNLKNKFKVNYVKLFYGGPQNYKRGFSAWAGKRTGNIEVVDNYNCGEQTDFLI